MRAYSLTNLIKLHRYLYKIVLLIVFYCGSLATSGQDIKSHPLKALMNDSLCGCSKVPHTVIAYQSDNFDSPSLIGVSIKYNENKEWYYLVFQKCDNSLFNVGDSLYTWGTSTLAVKVLNESKELILVLDQNDLKGNYLCIFDYIPFKVENDSPPYNRGLSLILTVDKIYKGRLYPYFNVYSGLNEFIIDATVSFPIDACTYCVEFYHSLYWYRDSYRHNQYRDPRSLLGYYCSKNRVFSVSPPDDSKYMIIRVYNKSAEISVQNDKLILNSETNRNNGKDPFDMYYLGDYHRLYPVNTQHAGIERVLPVHKKNDLGNSKKGSKTYFAMGSLSLKYSNEPFYSSGTIHDIEDIPFYKQNITIPTAIKISSEDSIFAKEYINKYLKANNIKPTSISGLMILDLNTSILIHTRDTSNFIVLYDYIVKNSKLNKANKRYYKIKKNKQYRKYYRAAKRLRMRIEKGRPLIDKTTVIDSISKILIENLYMIDYFNQYFDPLSKTVDGIDLQYLTELNKSADEILKIFLRMLKKGQSMDSILFEDMFFLGECFNSFQRNYYNDLYYAEGATERYFCALKEGYSQNIKVHDSTIYGQKYLIIVNGYSPGKKDILHFKRIKYATLKSREYNFPTLTSPSYLFVNGYPYMYWLDGSKNNSVKIYRKDFHDGKIGFIDYDDDGKIRYIKEHIVNNIKINYPLLADDIEYAIKKYGGFRFKSIELEASK